MPQIKRVLITNHTHHDIGFNDYQSVSFRQHGEFVHGALDLIEATADRPRESQYRWTCEVTGPLMKWLRGAGASEVERLRYWQQQGAIDVNAMQYNTTPLLTPEQMRRSLEPVRVLREEFGLSVETAMQDDVNGISWLFSDYLLDLGVDFLTMAINQHRGRAPRPFPGGFWWETPSGRKLLVWNGFHYLFGRSQAKLGDWERADQSLGYYLTKLEESPDYQYDTLYAESTHPMRVDNGPADRRMADFVHRWNEEGKEPVLEFAHPRVWRDELLSKWADTLPTIAGDWTDWWSDGVASSARETGTNRTTHELLATADTIGTWAHDAGGDEVDTARANQTYETMSLYDEHTWGAFSSIDANDALFSAAQWNHKSGFSYEAALETHDILTRASRRLASTLGQQGPEGKFNLGDLTDAEAYPEPLESELLVFNTLPYAREMVVDVPQYRAGGAPAGMLESFFPRDVPWGGNPSTPIERRLATVPAFGYAFVGPGETVHDEGLAASETTIENDYYRVAVDGATGQIISLFDKELSHDFASEWEFGGLGSYVYETVDEPNAREVLFRPDYSLWDFGEWNQNPPFNRRGIESAKVSIEGPANGQVELRIEVQADGIARGTLTVSLRANERAVRFDWLIDKDEHMDVEAVYIGFPFNLDDSEYVVDLNGLPLSPGDDQIDGSAMDFQPVRRWLGLSDGKHAVTLVPQDAPLVQLGGINTNKMFDSFDNKLPIAVSWAAHNHWNVNFQPSQKGRIPLRYVMTTHAGAVDVGASNKFAQEVCVPPVILRDYEPTADRMGTFFAADVPDTVEVNIRVLNDKNEVVGTFRNISEELATVSLPEAVRHYDIFTHTASDVEVSRLELPGRSEVSVLLSGEPD